jgi:hypothetical protein
MSGRPRVLPFPFLLFLLREEPHLGWFPFDASAIFDDLDVVIDLHFVQGLLLVFAEPRFEAGRISQL